MKKRFRSFPAAIHNARELRKNGTVPERILWNALRNRKLGGWKFRRQYPVGNLVLDFYCREKAIAVEIDGEIHNQPDIAAHDLERTRFIKRLGIKIIRFPNTQIVENLPGVLLEITKEIVKRK